MSNPILFHGPDGFIRLRTLGILLLAAVLAVFGATWMVCQHVARQIVDDAETQALGQMQVSAEALAGQIRLLAESLRDIQRLARLTEQMTRLGEGQGQAASLAVLREKMAQSQLGVSEMRLLDRSGGVLLVEGRTHEADPHPTEQPGFGMPWVGSAGQPLLRWISAPEAASPAVVEITFDPNRMSAALALVFPRVEIVNRAAGVNFPTEELLYNALVGTVARLSDGVIIARTTLEGRQLADGLRLTPTVLTSFRAQPSGGGRRLTATMRADILDGYRTIPELGVIAIALGGTDNLLEPARLRAWWWLAVPYGVLGLGLAAAGVHLTGMALRRQQRRVDELRHTAEAVAAAKLELEILGRHSPTLLYRGRLDPQGVFTLSFATENTKMVSGWEPAELYAGEPEMSHLPEEDRIARAANFVLAVRQGRSVLEYRVEQPDGGYRWLRCDVVVMERHADGSSDMVGSATNVTHEHELATRMALVDRMTTLGEMATSLAHELSQPVTVISMAASFAQILTQEIDSAEDLREQIGAILAQSKRAGEIIHHLRSYGHAEGGALGPVDLRLAIKGALELAGRPLRDAGVAVEVDLADDLPAVRARPVQVEQVLLNLAMNARDALRTGPSAGRALRFYVEPGGWANGAGQDDVVLCVADNGPGIPPGVIDRVFDPFFTTKKVGEGTGLGLALCRSMMEGFGGSISVADARPGVVFRLRFVCAESAGTEQRGEPAGLKNHGGHV